MTTTISGTHAVGSASGPTLATLRARVRAALPSVIEWQNATVDGWIADAIREYSATAPRRWRYTLTLATGTQAYALPSDKGLLSLASVEYPAGQDPPEFVWPVDEWSEAFGAGDDVYALRGSATTLAIESDEAPATIVFAETVTTGQTAIITFAGLHLAPTAGDNDAQISVPQPHWRALILYCVARAWDDLAMDTGLVTGEDAGALADLGRMAAAAWAMFEAAMREVAESPSVMGSGSAVVVWGGIGL